MGKITLDEMSALRLVLNYVSVKDLLTCAMTGFAEKQDTRSQDNADVCYKAINSFLEYQGERLRS